MFLLRLLIVGNTGVGKTSLLLRFNDDSFSPNQRTTVGVDYKAKETALDDGRVVKLQIWDTAGQERFRSMTSAYYSRAQGVVLVFDVSQRSSFDELLSWVNDVKDNAPANTPIILCASKADVARELWKVTKDEYEKFAHDFCLQVIETSSNTGHNVEALFHLAARDIIRSYENDGTVRLAHVVSTSKGSLSPEKSTDRAHSAACGPKIVLDASHHEDNDNRYNKQGKNKTCCTLM